MPHFDLDYQLTEAVLDNGLRVIVNRDPMAPAQAVNIWYQVGSADERAGATGFAHLFEHLMFSGSRQVASSEHLSSIESIGGSANATTSFDRTNFFETVPPGALELALWLEAERMESLAVTEENFATQREVVKEEKRQRYDNVPYGDQIELLLGLNFPTGHPYDHPPIGSMADLDAASLDDAQDFYRRWYRPDNAVLSVCGPLPPKDVIELARRQLGAIEPKAPDQPRQAIPARPHSGEPFSLVERAVPSTLLHLCWRTPPFADPAHLAVEQALAILASGQASRLPELLERRIGSAESVGSGDFGLSREVSLATITARVRRGHRAEEIIDATLTELDRLACAGPTAQELARANATFDREWLGRLASVEARADEISSFATLTGDPREINSLLSRVHAITADEIAQATRDWLAPAARATLVYQAQENR
ncbi:Predicted Zn-dependent peptidase [Propionibacterium cyclohexanicum]|uniref:Predicted Zn-dependent peptidase n=1 Tax=Propionibacterium cyclohexanicum TaxID=64702 RepID=A0A1H9R0D4_9ACTN|nr:pitrilysin family protein [Propionibacterium cyclohexanicum]SER65423.1 Predicted Zn-dependent peptidase [Propionibacterium cyclohexanicum]